MTPEQVEAFECARYALLHPESDQWFAIHNRGASWVNAVSVLALAYLETDTATLLMKKSTQDAR